MEAILIDDRLKENNIVVTDLKSGIARIHRQFKLELIQEYDMLYRIVNMTPINHEIFDELIEEDVAVIQKRVSILSAEAAVVTELSK
jgi:lysine/ornithine N-monooxygenase